MELKPCPFCGAFPNAPFKHGDSDERNGYNFYMVIACRCGIAIKRPSHEDKNGWCDDTGQALAAVVAAWNHRTSDHPAGTDK